MGLISCASRGFVCVCVCVCVCVETSPFFVSPNKKAPDYPQTKVII